MPIWSSVFFQNSNSPLMEHLIFFHDHAMIILISITTMVLYNLLSAISTNSFNRFFLGAEEMEFFWTALPAIMLVFMAIPSLKTLYMMEEIINPNFTIKALGHQWYWSYEYTDVSKTKYDAFMLKNKSIRLMETSNRLVIPTSNPIRILTTSTDVIHSWTIPSMGVKVDAIPGRINQMTIISNRPGVMVGQCSEICGMNHSFMPITLESVSTEKFMQSLNSETLY